jgi:hypothetical protein
MRKRRINHANRASPTAPAASGIPVQVQGLATGQERRCDNWQKYRFYFFGQNHLT